MMLVAAFRIRFRRGDTRSHPRGAFRPSFASSLRPLEWRGRREDRAPAGTRGPLCESCATRSCTAAYRCSQDSPAFPAQWVYGLCRALPGERCAIAPVALRMADAADPVGPRHHHKTWRTDSGRQDDTILPYANRTGRVRDALRSRLPALRSQSRRCGPRPPPPGPRS